MPIDTETPTLICDGVLTNKVKTEEIEMIDTTAFSRKINAMVFKHATGSPATGYTFLGTQGTVDYSVLQYTSNIGILDFGAALVLKIGIINLPVIPTAPTFGNDASRSKALVATIPFDAIMAGRSQPAPASLRYAGHAGFGWNGELLGYNQIAGYNSDVGVRDHIGYCNVYTSTVNNIKVLVVELWFPNWDYDVTAADPDKFNLALDVWRARTAPFTLFLEPY